MPNSPKIESAEELLELYHDFERVKSYYYKDTRTDTHFDTEKFYMDLPYQDIKYECFNFAKLYFVYL